MDKKIEVSEIKIKIGDREIPLTLAEAKELQKILNDTFGEELEPSIERPVSPRWDVPVIVITCDNITPSHQPNANGDERQWFGRSASDVSMDVVLEGEE
jgi:hypothetical protein